MLLCMSSGCLYDGRRYRDGQTFAVPGPQCQISYDVRYQVLNISLVTLTILWSLFSDCLYDGRRYRDGQTFAVPGPQCQICSCSAGNVRCQRSGSCPRLPCTVTEVMPGECCPRCKGKGENAVFRYFHCRFVILLIVL